MSSESPQPAQSLLEMPAIGFSRPGTPGGAAHTAAAAAEHLQAHSELFARSLEPHGLFGLEQQAWWNRGFGGQMSTKGSGLVGGLNHDRSRLRETLLECVARGTLALEQRDAPRLKVTTRYVPEERPQTPVEAASDVAIWAPNWRFAKEAPADCLRIRFAAPREALDAFASSRISLVAVGDSASYQESRTIADDAIAVLNDGSEVAFGQADEADVAYYELQFEGLTPEASYQLQADAEAGADGEGSASEPRNLWPRPMSYDDLLRSAPPARKTLRPGDQVELFASCRGADSGEAVTFFVSTVSEDGSKKVEEFASIEGTCEGTTAVAQWQVAIPEGADSESRIVPVAVHAKLRDITSVQSRLEVRVPTCTLVLSSTGDEEWSQADDTGYFRLVSVDGAAVYEQAVKVADARCVEDESYRLVFTCLVEDTRYSLQYVRDEESAPVAVFGELAASDLLEG